MRENIFLQIRAIKTVTVIETFHYSLKYLLIYGSWWSLISIHKISFKVNQQFSFEGKLLVDLNILQHLSSGLLFFEIKAKELLFKILDGMLYKSKVVRKNPRFGKTPTEKGDEKKLAKAHKICIKIKNVKDNYKTVVIGKSNNNMI